MNRSIIKFGQTSFFGVPGWHASVLVSMSSEDDPHPEDMLTSTEACHPATTRNDQRKSPTGRLIPSDGAGAADILAIVPNLGVGEERRGQLSTGIAVNAIIHDCGHGLVSRTHKIGEKDRNRLQLW